MKFLVSHSGVESGPFTLDEVVAKIRARELELFDYIFDEAKNDWVLMTEHEGVTLRLKANKPAAPPKAVAHAEAPKAAPSREAAEPQLTRETPSTAAIHSAAGEWFVMKGEHKFGPFTPADVIKMLQDKVIFPFDFIWHQGLKDWTRLAETQEFNPEQIKATFEKGGKAKEIFQPRKFKRQPYSGRVILHDNLKLWKGEGFEISKGGVGILMKNEIVVPGQQLNVHFGAHGEWPAFNAVCEVVSKKFVNDGSPVEYGLRFLNLSQEGQEYFNKKAAK